MGKHQENSHGDKAAPMAPLAPTAPLLQGLQSLELSATKITRTRGLKGHYVHVSFLQAQGSKGGQKCHWDLTDEQVAQGAQTLQ